MLLLWRPAYLSESIIRAADSAGAILTAGAAEQSWAVS